MSGQTQQSIAFDSIRSVVGNSYSTDPLIRGNASDAIKRITVLTIDAPPSLASGFLTNASVQLPVTIENHGRMTLRYKFVRGAVPANSAEVLALSQAVAVTRTTSEINTHNVVSSGGVLTLGSQVMDSARPAMQSGSGPLHLVLIDTAEAENSELVDLSTQLRIGTGSSLELTTDQTGIVNTRTASSQVRTESARTTTSTPAPGHTATAASRIAAQSTRITARQVAVTPIEAAWSDSQSPPVFNRSETQAQIRVAASGDIPASYDRITVLTMPVPVVRPAEAILQLRFTGQQQTSGNSLLRAKVSIAFSDSAPRSASQIIAIRDASLPSRDVVDTIGAPVHSTLTESWASSLTLTRGESDVIRSNADRLMHVVIESTPGSIFYRTQFLTSDFDDGGAIVTVDGSLVDTVATSIGRIQSDASSTRTTVSTTNTGGPRTAIGRVAAIANKSNDRTNVSTAVSRSDAARSVKSGLIKTRTAAGRVAAIRYSLTRLEPDDDLIVIKLHTTATYSEHLIHQRTAASQVKATHVTGITSTRTRVAGARCDAERSHISTRTRTATARFDATHNDRTAVRRTAAAGNFSVSFRRNDTIANRTTVSRCDSQITKFTYVFRPVVTVTAAGRVDASRTASTTTTRTVDAESRIDAKRFMIHRRIAASGVRGRKEVRTTEYLLTYTGDVARTLFRSILMLQLQMPKPILIGAFSVSLRKASGERIPSFIRAIDDDRIVIAIQPHFVSNADEHTFVLSYEEDV